MAGFSFRQNMVFEWNNSKFKVLKVQETGELVLEEMFTQALFIEKREKLLVEYTAGNLRAHNNKNDLTSSVPLFSRPLDELSKAVREEVQRRRYYLGKILAQDQSPVFTNSYLQPIIKSAAAEISDLLPPSPRTIQRWYKQYRKSGDTRALIPRTDLRGSRKLRQSELVLKLATEAIEEAFRISPQANLSTIYTRLLGKITIEHHKNQLGEQIKPPSKRTLRRMLGRVEIYEITRMKTGKNVADKRFRISQYSTKTSRILERVEADHTPLDLFIIDETTWLPLGRPTLTVLIDHFSRMLLGYYLTFESPSTTAVMGALRHAILPKQLESAKIPNLQVNGQWPCYGLPEVLVVDNGLEFHSDDFESVAFDLGIRIQYCPKHEPRFKGVVERYLKTINYSFANQIPGASLARFHLRGDYDPQKNALLTLGEFKHLFDKWSVDVYAQTVHQGIGTTPIARWNESMLNHSPTLPSDIDLLKRRIGRVEERSLRRDGIWMNSICYNGDVLAPILRAYGIGVLVRIVFDPEDLGDIQVWGPDMPDPVTVSALNREYAKGLTLKQHQLIQRILREKGRAAENLIDLEQARFELAQAIEKLMVNRKQTARRRSAALRGLTSNRPEGSDNPSLSDLHKPKEDSKENVPQKKAKKEVKAQSVKNTESELPPLLPSFHLGKQRNSDEQ